MTSFHISMRTALLLSALTGFGQCSFAQPAWAWARSFGNTGYETANATALDSQGNQLIAGQFDSATLTIGPSTLTSAGYEDGLIVKLDPNGAFLWAISAGGTGYDNATDLTVDADDNAVVVGWLDSTAVVGNGPAMTSAGYFDGFVAKVAPGGSVLWSRLIGTTGNDHVEAVAADQTGNIFIAGDFGSTTMTLDGITVTGGPSSYVAKLDADGLAEWILSFHGVATGISTASDGSAYLSGYFFDDLSLDGLSITSNGDGDGFLAKVDGQGSAQWLWSAGGNGRDEFRAVQVDPTGHVAVAGFHTSDSFSIGNQNFTNPQPGYEQALVVQLDATGAVLWASAATGGGNKAMGIAPGTSGGHVITGYFEGDALAFGSINVGPGTFERDCFVAGFGANGAVQWAQVFGGTDQDQALSICGDGNGTVGVAGWYSSPTMAIGATVLNLVPGSNDVFVARMGSSTGITSSTWEAAVQLSPNPVAAQVRVQCGGHATRYTLIDPQGRTIAQGNPQRDAFDLDLSGTPAGCYLLRLLVDGRWTDTRLVKD